MALQLKDEPSWIEFLSDAGVPATEATGYAKMFVDNRINERTVKNITETQLNQLGITVLGDVLAILDHVKASKLQSGVANSTSTHVYRPPPTTVKMPTILSEMTRPQFRKFRVDWDVYKKIVNVPLEQIGPLLYNACGEQVQSSIVNSYPTFFDLSEDRMLEVVETV